MYLACVILVVLASILMCFFVLIQKSKGGGLASNFASSNQIMGVRKTTDFLEKTTWFLALFMAVVSVLASLSLPDVVVVDESLLQQNAVETAISMPDFQQETTTPAVDALPAEEAPAN